MAKKTEDTPQPAAKKDTNLLVPTRYTIPPQPMTKAETIKYIDELKKKI